MHGNGNKSVRLNEKSMARLLHQGKNLSGAT